MALCGTFPWLFKISCTLPLFIFFITDLRLLYGCFRFSLFSLIFWFSCCWRWARKWCRRSLRAEVRFRLEPNVPTFGGSHWNRQTPIRNSKFLLAPLSVPKINMGIMGTQWVVFFSTDLRTSFRNARGIYRLSIWIFCLADAHQAQFGAYT